MQGPILSYWGVKVGYNAFIGALSLVNKDVPDNAIVIGIPARVLKIRTQEDVFNWHCWVMQNGGVKLDDFEELNERDDIQDK